MIETVTVILAARSLRSENGENPEYDRALVELTSDILQIDPNHRDVVAFAIGIEVER